VTLLNLQQLWKLRWLNTKPKAPVVISEQSIIWLTGWN